MSHLCEPVLLFVRGSALCCDLIMYQGNMDHLGIRMRVPTKDVATKDRRPPACGLLRSMTGNIDQSRMQMHPCGPRCVICGLHQQLCCESTF